VRPFEGKRINLLPYGRGVAKFREMCGQFGGRWVAKLVGQLSGLEIGISQKYDISK
jgi:hypothetical protein